MQEPETKEEKRGLPSMESDVIILRLGHEEKDARESAKTIGEGGFDINSNA